MYLKLATLSDLPSFLGLCRAFYEESPFSPQVLYSESKVTQFLIHSIETEYSQAVPLLLLDSQTVVGMLLGYATAVPFSDDKVAAELAWYVEPSYRGHREALQLVYAYEEWAQRVGCKHVSMSLLTTLTDVSKLYERLGYKKTEISYMKEIK